MGYAELALTTEMSSEGREYIESLKAAAYVLMGVLADVLDVAALDAGRVKLEPKPFSVRDVIEAHPDAAAVVRNGEGALDDGEVGSGVPDRLLGDPLKFAQIMKALVGNAVKFTDVER